MIDRRKKYKVHDSLYPNVGGLIKAHIKKEKINNSFLAAKLGIARSGFARYMKQESLQLGIIWKISVETQYNFLAALAEQLPIDFETKKEKEIQKLLTEKTIEIEKLQSELEVYKRIVGK